MINTDVSSVTYNTAEGQAIYSIPFPFNEDLESGTPELSVTLDGVELQYNGTGENGYTITPDGLQLAGTVAANKVLVIKRKIRFVQDYFFQVGLIDAKQIEAAFDDSVMRDQELATSISDLDAKHDSLAEEVEEVRTVAEGAAADAASAAQTATDAASAANSASKKADEAKTAADNADSKAQEALDLANSYDTRITTAQNTADSAKTTAEQALSALAGKQDKGDYATKTELSQGLAGKADTSVTDALRTDVDGLGDQVSGVEEKIPADASSSNQLATKADLSNIGALPSQAGNEGKFLTTDGANASWVEIGQGGGLVAVVHDDTLEGDGTDANPLKLSTSTAAEISAAQSTADKADNAAEVAQQTANLAGQEAAQALSALAGKVNIDQGEENAGKVMTVGADGNLAPADAPSSSAITTDATLAGTGTPDSPLGVAQSVKDSIDGKLPLAGGELANGATVVLPGTLRLVNEASTNQHWNITAEDGAALRFTSSALDKGFSVNSLAIRPLNTTSMDLGTGAYPFDIAYIHGINNGADIAIPTTGGTMALLSDIPDTSNLATKAEVQQEIQDAIGTIETALAEV